MHYRLLIAKFKNQIYGTKIPCASHDIEVPLNNPSIGLLHLVQKKERATLFYKYKDALDKIINDPDFIFEDKKSIRDGTIIVSKKIRGMNVMLVIRLCTCSSHTNTLVTMWEKSDKEFMSSVKGFEKLKKVLYKK